MQDQLRKMGAKLNAQTAAGVKQGLNNGAKSAGAAGKKTAEDFTGAFNHDVQRGLDKAVKDIGKRTGGAFNPAWNNAFEKVADDLRDLQKERIGFTIDENTFNKSVENMRGRLLTLEKHAPSAGGFYDARGARQNLDAVLGTMEEARKRGSEQAAVYAGSFRTQFDQAMAKSFQSIKEIEIKVNTAPAEVDLETLRQQILLLSGKTIGIDISSAEAMAEIRRIHEGLRALDRDDVDIHLRVDARRAADELKRFQDNADGSANSVTKMEKAASLSMSRMQHLIALGASIGSVFVPGAAAAAGAIGFIGTSAAAAAAGVGVMALGLHGIGDALGEMQKFEDVSAKSSASLDSDNRKVAGSTDAVSNAVRALGNTRRTVAEGAADAERAVGDAVRETERARHDEGIASREAARLTADAQRDLSRAETDAKEVRTALNAAIKEARKDLVDLRVELSRNRQDQSKAVTAQLAALNELHALQENPRSSEVELRRARDNVNEQTVRLEELAKKRRELSKQQTDYASKNVETDSKVIAARKRIVEADEKVADAKVKVQRADEDAAEKRVAAAGKVEDAERRVGVAAQARARQRIDGAFQIANAEAAIVAAARTQEGATGRAAERAATAGTTALDNLNTAMQKLTPTQQGFVKFIFGLKGDLQDLRKEAADPMLPGLQTAIEMLLPYLPGVSRFIGKVAAQLGSMAVQAAAAFKGPMWQKFFDYIDKSAVPTMKTWFEITDNVMQGLLGLYLALTPLDGQVGSGLVKLSEDFASWAAALGKSQGYKEFLEYVRENGPRVVHLLGELGLLGIRLLEAYAPIGEVALKALTLLADGLNSIPMPVLTILVGIISVLALSISTLGAVIRAQKFKTELGKIFGEAQQRAVQKYAIDTGRATAETGKFRTAVATAAGATVSLRDRLVGMPARIQQSFGAANTRMVEKYAIATGFASAQSSGFHKAMGTVAGSVQIAGNRVKGMVASMGGVRGAFSSLAGFLGGPWGIALAAGTYLITEFTNQAAKQEQRVEELDSALALLSDKYKELSKTGQQSGRSADDAFRAMVASNPDLQKTVVMLNGLGVGFEDIISAATSGDPSKVIRAIGDELARVNYELQKGQGGSALEASSKRAKELRARRDELEAQRKTFIGRAKAVGLATEAERILSEQDRRAADIELIKTANQKAGTEAIKEATSAYDAYGTRIEQLNGFLATFASGQGDVSAKADALRQYIDNDTSSMQKAAVAADEYQLKLYSLGETLKQNGKSIDGNSKAAIGNRTALRDAAGAVRELYIQDIASGTPMNEATRRHEERIKKLKEEAYRGTNNKTAVDKLVNSYGQIPPEVVTMLETGNFKQVYEQLEQMKFMQEMLVKGKTAEEAAGMWKSRVQARKLANVNPFAYQYDTSRRAAGGPIDGPGTGTSDEVPIWASDGEHMITAKEVQAAGGHEAIYAWRRAILAGASRPKFAKGGAVTWPFKVDLSKTKIPTLEEVQDALRGGGGGGAGLAGSGSVSGSPAMERLMESAIRGTTVTSSYRPGSPGYHGKKPHGRAIDMIFSDGSERHGGGRALEAFNYIASHYGKGTKELIWDFSPWGLSTGIWNGGRHQFRSGTSGPGTHNDHLHWAYDNGGMLQPGVQQVVNMTGKPEPVLTQPQWAAVETQNGVMQQLVSQANQVGAGGNTYQFEFKDTTLDAAWVRAQQQRDDALQRVSRAR